MSATTVQTGLEVFLANGLPDLAGSRIGLITNQTGVDRRFTSTVDLLRASHHIQLAALFGPEHGVRGEAQAGVKVGGATDPRTGLPVYSLYGDTRRPTAEMLDGLDALMIDLQDVGVRYATYISTMAYAQGAAAAAGLPFVVLDRPNPLSGGHIEGSLLDPAFASFVGVHPLPVRHGMTMGELARLFAAEHGYSAPLVVVMHGYSRAQWYDQTGLPWVGPSPNLPALDSVTLYPGTCLIEGTNLSEGRGTTRPFELIGAPWIDPFQLAGELERRRLPGWVDFRPAYFTPTFSKHAQAVCGGVQIYILDREAARPVELGLHLLHALRGLAPDAFAWREGDSRFFIDLLLGSDRPRRSLDAGAEVAEVMSGWIEEIEAFERRRRPFLLYD